MSFIPADIKEKAKEAAENSRFIKAEHFEGEGLTLQCLGFEKFTASNPKFGADEKDALYKQDILAKGESFRYSFRNKEGEEKVYETKSAAIFIAFNDENLNLENGDWVRVSKTGKMDETRYTVEKVSAITDISESSPF